MYENRLEVRFVGRGVDAMIDETHVQDRLTELRDWATYIHESLTQDQRYEKGKLTLLERLVDSEDLKLAREEARVLTNRLRALAEQADLKPTAAP